MVISLVTVLPVSKTVGGAIVSVSAENFKRFETYSQHIDYLKENGYYYEEENNEDGSVDITTYTGNGYLLKSKDGLLYYCNDDETVINGYVGHKLNVNIPSEIEGKPVTKLLTQLGAEYASYDINGNYCANGGGGGFGMYNSVNVYIPDTVTQIGEEYKKSDGSIGYNLMDAPILMVYSEKSSVAEIFSKYGDEFESYGYRSCVGTPFEDVETEFWFDYEIKEDGTINTTKYRGYEAEVVVPNEIGGKKVTSIGDFTFQDCDILTSVTIPNSVTSIGFSAFSHCYNLTSVNISDSVTSIGERAFSYCESLTSVNIPDSVISIGEDAFYDTPFINNQTTDVKYAGKWAVDCNSNITSVSIKNDTVGIAGHVFENCESLTSVTIPNSVTSIGDCAFQECTNLTSVNIPDSVTSIGEAAFSACVNLTSINIPNSVTSIEDRAFCLCESLSSITIPNSVKSIGKRAFSACVNLTSINIPDSVTSIEDSAFWECYSLTSVNIPDSVTSIGECTFLNCNSLTSITVDLNNSNYSSQDGVLFNKNKTELIQYPSGKAETTYTIPNSVISIGNWAFSGVSLTSVIIPNSVTSIGESAFAGCCSLASVNIPDSVTSIGYQAFGSCTSLTSIVLHNNITDIGEYAFFHCENLISITIPNSVTSIRGGAFIGCGSLTSVTIPDGVTNIEDAAFASCDNLTNVTIPNSVTSIGHGVFENCTNFKDVYYIGSESEWKKINIGSYNGALTNATIHYNYVQNQIDGTVYYQQKIDKSAVRFIAEVDVEDVQNSNSSNIKILYDNEEYNIEIKTAYLSILANGHKVEAKQGKCFIVSPTIPINNDDKNLVTAQFTLDSCNGSLIRELIL